MIWRLRELAPAARGTPETAPSVFYLMSVHCTSSTTEFDRSPSLVDGGVAVICRAAPGRRSGEDAQLAAVVPRNGGGDAAARPLPRVRPQHRALHHELAELALVVALAVGALRAQVRDSRLERRPAEELFADVKEALEREFGRAVIRFGGLWSLH